MTSEARYRVLDCPANGAAGQDCGAFAESELPERLRLAVADPGAAEWVLPALSGGGEELSDLRVCVTSEE